MFPNMQHARTKKEHSFSTKKTMLLSCLRNKIKQKLCLLSCMAHVFYILCSTKNATIQNNSNCYIPTLFHSVFLVTDLSCLRNKNMLLTCFITRREIHVQLCDSCFFLSINRNIIIITRMNFFL